VLSAVGAGLSGAAGLIGTAALTATALSVAAGRPVPVAFAFRLVAARAGLIRPIIALGIGWMAVALLSVALQGSPDLQNWAGAPGSPRTVLIGSLLGLLAVVVAVGIIVFAVRWALYIPAVLVESIGVGAGLARAAGLSRGIRVRIALAMAGVVLLETLVVAIVATICGLVVGFSTGSVGLGIAVYLAANVVGSTLWAPWLPSMLAVVYRERTLPADAAGGLEAGAAPGGQAEDR
jgi:hypothetical protein